MKRDRVNRPILKYAIHFIFVGFFIFWLAQIDTSKLGRVLGDLKVKYIIYFVASYILSYALYAKKYHLLFSRIKQVRYIDLFFLTCSGSYSNFIVPASGEVLKAYVLKKREGIHLAKSAVIILLERFLSAVILLFLLWFVVSFIDLPSTLRRVVLYSLIILIASIIVGGFVIHRRDRIRQILEKILEIPPMKYLSRDTIRKLNQPEILREIFCFEVMFYFTVYSLLKFVFDGFRLYFILRTIGYDLPYLECLAAKAIINSAVMIPILPASIGSFEFVSVSILHYVFAVPLEMNILEIFLERLLSTLLLFILGFVSLSYLNVSKQEIGEQVGVSPQLE
jgi:uncharacterized protein (TIRG00374 family)